MSEGVEHLNVVPIVEALRRLNALRRDPTLTVLAFAAWSLVAGVQLLWPGSAFEAQPGYWTLRNQGVPEEIWGAWMVIDASFLMMSALFGGPVVRPAVSAISGAFWLWFGAHVCHGTYVKLAAFSLVGSWEVIVGFALLATTVQWASHGD